MKRQMVIGEEYRVLVGEYDNGNADYETLPLSKIEKFEDKEIYIFTDDFGNRVYDYERNENEEFDWSFMERIIDKFEF